MALDTHVRRGHPILFGALLFFSIITACIATWLSAKFGQHHNAFTHNILIRTHFLTFVGWWTVIFGGIYMALFLHSASTGSAATSVLSHVVFLFITWIFWTAGAASITQALGGGFNCSKISFNVAYCNQLNALEGFSWVCWIFVTILLLASIFLGIRSMRRGDGMKGQLVTY